MGGITCMQVGGEGFQGKNPAVELATMQNVFKNVLSMSEVLR